MPELREDPLTGTSVIVAPGRASRPDTHRAAHAAPAATRCPFCPGNEDATPPEVARTGLGAPGTPGWQIRVVPNLYPIVGDDFPGAHEVVVLSPDHDASFGRLTDEHATEVFAVLRDRSAHHLQSGLVHAQPFINHGRAAGASIEHPHAQLVALPIVPPAVDVALARFAAHERDLVVDELEAARANDHCVLANDPDDVLAWCSPTSLSAYEVLVARATSGARFDTAPDADIAAIATASRRVLGAVAAVLGDVPYNLVVHTAPGTVEGGYHWYVRIIPRITVAAGFEFATGLAVNPVPPLRAAAELREAVDAP